MNSIIFDFGNVLGTPNHMKACEKLSKYSKLSAQELYNQVFLSDLEIDHEMGLVDKNEFWNKLQPFFIKELSDKLFFEFWGDISTPNKELEKILNRIKPSIEKYILSNTEDIHWEYISKLDIIKNLFKKKNLFLSFLMNDRKPNRSFYRKCLEKINKPAEKIIYVDDNPDFVSAFTELGVYGIQYDCEVDDIGCLISELSQFDIF